MNARAAPALLDVGSLRSTDSVQHGLWDAAVETSAFRQLIAMKIRAVGFLLAASFAFIVGMSLLAGYDKPLMATKLLGAVNVGYLLVFLTYLLCWIVSVAYVRIANERFDAQARVASASVSRGGRA